MPRPARLGRLTCRVVGQPCMIPTKIARRRVGSTFAIIDNEITQRAATLLRARSSYKTKIDRNRTDVCPEGRDRAVKTSRPDPDGPAILSSCTGDDEKGRTRSFVPYGRMGFAPAWYRVPVKSPTPTRQIFAVGERLASGRGRDHSGASPRHESVPTPL